MKNKKALIINEGFSHNFGDQAIKRSMSKLLHDNNYDVKFAYYSRPKIKELPSYYDGNNFKKRVQQKKSRSFLIKILIEIKNIIDSIKWLLNNKKVIKEHLVSENFDLVVIGGGQLINTSNKYVVPSIFALALRLWTQNTSKNSKLYLIAVGSASSFNFLEKYLYQKSLKLFDKIWVRDTYSKSIFLKEFEIDSELIPDIAFYEDDKFKAPSIENVCLLGIYSFQEFSIKFNNNNLNKEEYYEQWYNKLVEFQNEGYVVKLFYTTLSDAEESIMFSEYLNAKFSINLEVVYACSLEELEEIYLSATLVYSARMHALLLAKKCGLKVIPYLISQKLKSFNDEYILSKYSNIEFKRNIEDKVVKFL